MALCAIAVIFTGANHAFAGQYASETLGTALPMWMETLASVNDEGDVAWTQWDQSIGSNVTDNATRARFYNDANDLLLPSASSAWAVGVSQRVTNGDNTVVAIAGSQASSQRMTDRSAMLWSVSWLTAGNGAATAIDVNLGEHTPKLAQGATGTVQQSAAYAVHVPPGSNANTYTVGGFARDKVDKSTYPQPVIWAVSQATSNPVISRQALTLLHPAAAVGSGYVASIAYNSDTHTTWACGNSTGSHNAYNHATCWDISTGNTSPSPAIINALSSKYGASNVVSSMVHRVRSVATGNNGALSSIAVGAALINSGNGPQWKAWTYDLDDNTLRDDLALTSGHHETFAYDVASIEYRRSIDADTYSRGMIIAGISSSAASAGALGGLTGGIEPPTVSAMRGVDRRMMLTGVTDEGKVCAIDDDSEYAGASYEQLLALSSDATYRLAMAAGQLVRLTAVPEDVATLEIRNRDATVKQTRRTARTALKYYQAQATLANPVKAVRAVLRFGKNLDCSPLDTSGLSACGNWDPAAFDIENSQTLTLEAVHGMLVPADGQSATLRSTKQMGATFADGSVNYAQIALQKGDSCTISPVLPKSKATVTPGNLVSIGQKHSDFDGREWTYCNAADKWVDLSQDADYCSACDNPVDTLTCADTKCENSTPKLHTIDGGWCAMGTSNDWSCISEGTFEQVPLNYDSSKFQDNRCHACDPTGSNSKTDWTKKSLSEEYYQCIAHHWNTRFGVPGKPVWAFFTDSNEGSANGANFKLRDYWTNHMCAYAVGQNNDSETRNVSNTNTWERKISPGKDTTYTWPGSFQGMPSRNGKPKEFTNTPETRDWLFQRRLRYLGQMNGGSWSNDGRNYYMGWGATTFYLQPGQEEWFLFYYNDPQKWQDRIGALVQFDGTQMDLDVDLHFACARDGGNNHPRMDGFMDCGAEGHGNKGDKRSAFGVGCGPVTGSGYDRASYCRANTWRPYSELPWTFDGGDSWDGRVPSDWGNKQGGIYVEGHIDCGALPHKDSNQRDGWVFVKVKRRDTNATTCTPITLRSTWFHHKRKIGFTNCWD